MAELENLVKEVAEARDYYMDCHQQVDIAQSKFEEEHSMIFIELKVANDNMRIAEEKLRASILETSDEEIKATFGVAVKTVKKLEYDKEEALKWAAMNYHYKLLSLNVRNFETAAKALEPDFVTITKAKQPQITKDLSSLLEK
jgi:hypothetical protein